MKQLFYFSVFLASLMSWLALGADELTLNGYLKQVQEKHSGLQASAKSREGTNLRSAEARMLYFPTLSANVQLAKDEKPGALFPYRSITNQSYSLGISQLTNFGLKANLSYTMNFTEYVGINVPFFYEGKPMIELTQSLWRNAFGREVRASFDIVEANALATSYGESFKVKLTLSDAETGYWRLALAREAIAVQQDAFQRAKKLFEWNEKRANLQLADSTDLYQAQAAMELRNLQLQAAQDEERAAAALFNRNRGVTSEAVAEKLAPLSPELISTIQIPKKGEMRDDVRSAKEAKRAAIASQQISLEKNSPTLDVYAAYAVQSQIFNGSFSDAFNQSLGTQMPYKAIGIKFATPLSFGALLDTRNGYSEEQKAAELNYERKLFEQEQDWTELNRKFQEAKKRYDLARSIETIQQKKMVHERERLTKGRTTTYQVLTFEQDFAQSALMRIQTQAELLQVVARMKTFVETSETL